MSLNILKGDNADNEKIVNFVKSLAENIEYEILSEEIMFRIPVKDDDNAEKKLRKKVDIPKFFQKFDENLENLKIRSSFLWACFSPITRLCADVRRRRNWN